MMLCDDCIHAGRVTGFPDGDMFVCECEHDPRVPFNMDEGVDCPLYKKAEEWTPTPSERSSATCR